MHPAIRGALCRGLLVLGVVLCASAPIFAFGQVFDQTYPFVPGGRFELENVNGSVQVDGWEREEVEVRAVKTARRNALDLEKVRIEVESNSSGVAVRTRYPQGDGVEVAVDYRVRIPYRVLLGDIETVNGSVRVRGVEGAGELRAVNGNVEVLDSSGRFSARTTNGNVRMELRRLDDDGPMLIATINGSVVLALPAGTGANLDVRSMNGDFHSELPIEASGSLSARAFRGRLGSGGAELSIRTINGGIRLILERPSV